MASQWKFGQTLAADYEPEEFSADDVYIRTFKDGTTRVRIAPCEGQDKHGNRVVGAFAWPTQREHYDPGLQISYGCIADLGAPQSECKGCSSDQERIRKRSRYYYVNAFDKDNQLRIFKFGIKVWTTLSSRQERLARPGSEQPLSDVDILVTRMGKDFNDITYDIDWGEKYPVDFPAEMFDIPKILGQKFEEAMAKYNGGEPLAKPDATEDRTGAAATQQRSSGIRSTSNGQTTATNAEEASELTEEGRLGEIPTEDQLADADTGELKRWLKETAKVDFPQNAPRSRLIKIAKEVLAIPF